MSNFEITRTFALFLLISLQISNGNGSQTQRLFELDTFEEHSTAEAEYWSSDCHYSRKQVFTELSGQFQGQGFWTPGSLEICRISFDATFLNPISVGFEGLLRRGSEIEVVIESDGSRVSYQIEESDLESSSWEIDLKDVFAENGENLRVSFWLMTSQKKRHEEVDDSIAILDLVWVLTEPMDKRQSRVKNDNIEDIERLREAEEPEQFTEEPTTSDPTDSTESTSNTTPSATYPPYDETISIGTKEDMERDPAWHTTCEYFDTLEEVEEHCYSGSSIPTPSNGGGFWTPCHEPRCIIRYDSDRVELSKFQVHVYVQGDGGYIEPSSLKRIGTDGEWANVDEFVPEINSGKITFLLITGSAETNVALIEHIILFGWSKAPLPGGNDDKDSEDVILIVSIVGGVAVITLVVGALAFYFISKKRRSNSENRKASEIYSRQNEAFEDVNAGYPRGRMESEISVQPEYNFRKPQPQPQLQGRVNRGFDPRPATTGNWEFEERFRSGIPRHLLMSGRGGGGPRPLPGMANPNAPRATDNMYPDVNFSSPNPNFSLGRREFD